MPPLSGGDGQNGRVGDLSWHDQVEPVLVDRSHDEASGVVTPTREQGADRVDALERIDEIIATVENARAVPMSRNCLIDRQELISVLEELRVELPVELRRAANLLEERDKILDAGKREADRIIAEGEQEHARLVSVHEVVVSAEHEANRIISEARQEAQRLRDEVDDYVDTALANFEQFLTRALASIERGRDKMHALREIGTFASNESEQELPQV
jgi:vacuolar-type H+-ATPase subunit H